MAENKRFYSEAKSIIETVIRTTTDVIRRSEEENPIKEPNVIRRVSKRFTSPLYVSQRLLMRGPDATALESETVLAVKTVSTDPKAVTLQRQRKHTRRIQDGGLSSLGRRCYRT